MHISGGRVCVPLDSVLRYECTVVIAVTDLVTGVDVIFLDKLCTEYPYVVVPVCTLICVVSVYCSGCSAIVYCIVLQ